MNIPMALNYLRPGESWTLDGNTYDGLTWLADTAKPTEAEIAAAWPLAQAEADAREAARQSARLKIAESSGLTPEEMAALGIL